MRCVWILLSAFLGLGGATYAQDTQKVPEFQTFKRYDTGQVFTVDSLSNTGINVLIFYDPGCGHCQELGSDIATRWSSWRENLSFYFISMMPAGDVRSYIGRFAPNLKSRSNVVFLHDAVGEFISLFDPKSFPSVYIYQAETGGRIAAYEGISTTKEIEAYLLK